MDIYTDIYILISKNNVQNHIKKKYIYINIYYNI